VKGVGVNPVAGALTAVVLGGVVVGGTVLALHGVSPKPPLMVVDGVAASATGIPGVTKTAELKLESYPDSAPITWRRTNDGVGPHPGWVSYGPTTNIQLPANTLVTVTITNYDGGEPIPNPGYLASVHGTVGGDMTIDGEKATSIDPSHVGHTFTIHNYPSDTQESLYVSVPIPAVPDDLMENPPAEPSASNPYGWPPKVVKFQFVTKGPGDYAWNCEFPCGGNYAGMGEAMSSYGYMSGVIHVV